MSKVAVVYWTGTGNTLVFYDDPLSVLIVQKYVTGTTTLGTDGKLVSVAAGTGEMDYTEILRFLKARKPYIQASLENTTNDNAVQSRLFLEELYQKL